MLLWPYSQVYIPKRGTLIQVLPPLKFLCYLLMVYAYRSTKYIISLASRLINMHEQVAKSLVYALAGGSTCMSVRLLGMKTCDETILFCDKGLSLLCYLPDQPMVQGQLHDYQWWMPGRCNRVLLCFGNILRVLPKWRHFWLSHREEIANMEDGVDLFHEIQIKKNVFWRSMRLELLATSGYN